MFCVTSDDFFHLSSSSQPLLPNWTNKQKNKNKKKVKLKTVRLNGSELFCHFYHSYPSIFNKLAHKTSINGTAATDLLSNLNLKTR